MSPAITVDREKSPLIIKTLLAWISLVFLASITIGCNGGGGGSETDDGGVDAGEMGNGLDAGDEGPGGDAGADTDDSSLPTVALNDMGVAVVVWESKDSTDLKNIRTGWYRPGAGWSEPEPISSGSPASDAVPQVVMDPMGNALAVWIHVDDAWSIFANRYVIDKGWGTAAAIEHDNSGNAISPQIAVNAEGHAIAIWQQHDGARNNIWSAQFQ